MEVDACDSSAFFRREPDGVHIEVDSPGTVDGEGVIYVHVRYDLWEQAGGGGLSCCGEISTRHSITLADRATARVVVYHHPSCCARGQVRAQTQMGDQSGGGIDSTLQIRLGRGAELTFWEVTETGDRARSRIDVFQQGGSLLRMGVIDLNNSVLERKLGIALEGEGAICELGGLYLSDGEQRVDNQVKISHLVRDCRSTQLFKGVVAGGAMGSFTGHIYVARGAEGTVAVQGSHSLVLSEGARVKSEPQLEIYADQVQCNHGATVGRLDPEAIYYMRQRGISRAEARRLQIAGFAAQLVERCPVEPLRHLLERKIAARLEL